jgi:hypothetical protein
MLPTWLPVDYTSMLTVANDEKMKPFEFDAPQSMGYVLNENFHMKTSINIKN